MVDHARKDEYPLSVMLDVFQSIQRQGAPFLLALTGLPTLFPKLVEARTYSERMFRVLFLNRLDPPDVREAIVKPIQEDGCPITFTEESIRQIEKHSSGFSPSHASQILAALINSGIVFRNRHGKYSFAVPLLGDFIRRQYPAEQPELIDVLL